MPFLSFPSKLLLFIRDNMLMFTGSSPAISADFFSKEDQNTARLSSVWPHSGHLKTASYTSQMASKKQVHFCVSTYTKIWHGNTGFLNPAALSLTIAKTRGLTKSIRIQHCIIPRSHRASLRFTLYSKGAHEDKLSWLPPGRMQSEILLA